MVDGDTCGDRVAMSIFAKKKHRVVQEAAHAS